MAESLKHKAFIGTVWSSLERFSVQGIQFVVMIIMARQLTPDDYGLVSMLTIFIALSQSLVDCGFSNALIRKQDRSEIDNSTVFFFNVAVGIILYIILFISAPFIAGFYHQPLLVPITRLISISVVINSLVVVQRSLLTVKIDFKTQTIASFCGAVISGIVGVYMAFNGYGVWSIVWQQLLNLTINTLMLWILAKWRPILAYSWKSFKQLFGFGSKLAVSGVIDTIYNNIYLIVIGKIFNASDLGYYTRAYQFAQFPSSNFTGIIQRVTYPILCSFQNDITMLRNIYRRSIRLSTFFVFPFMMLLAALAQPLILVLLKEQWSFSIILLQILCFSMMWYPMHSLNLNLLQVQGRSDLYLKLEIIKKIIGISILCLTIPFGLVAMCIGTILSSIICLIVNTHYTGKLIQVGFLIQMKDIFPTLLYSLSMGALVFWVISFIPGLWMKLICGTAVGIIYFCLVTKLTKSSDLREAISFFKDNI